jgi:UDP-2-acetamido-2-deoxy-ribo-hexuluronate aminotransferase
MIPFIDLQAQRARISDKINAAISRVLDHGAFVMGPEIAALEAQMGSFSQAQHTVACANGTEALALPLMAWELRPNDAVFCPSFTFAATAEVVPWLGAVPVFVDVDADTYTMSPASLEAAIASTKAEGKLRPCVVIAVDLFGQPADYVAISAICQREGLKLIADSAQGYGCTLHGKHPLNWADITTTSFFPAKPLGCYGDGGAIQTNDPELAALCLSLRNHGAGADRYDNVRIGLNCRLDTIQAAVLIEKLAIFPDEIVARNRIAKRYSAALGHVAKVPNVITGGTSTWAQYTIEVADRDGLQAHLKAAEIPTAIYYSRPTHKQTAYANFPLAPDSLPVTNAASGKVISLPMHPYLDETTQDRIIAETIRFCSGTN